MLPVPQRNTASTATDPNFDLIIERAPPARRAASLGRRGSRLKSRRLDQSSRGSSLNERARSSTRRGLPPARAPFEGRHRAGIRIDPQRHRHVCLAPDPREHPRWTSTSTSSVAQVPRVVNRHMVNTRWSAPSMPARSRPSRTTWLELRSGLVGEVLEAQAGHRDPMQPLQGCDVAAVVRADARAAYQLHAQKSAGRVLRLRAGPKPPG